MRQQLIRSTVLAVGLAIVITMAPVGFAIWNASVGDGRGVVGQWLADGTPSATSMRLVGVVLALAALALAAGVFVAIRQAHQLSQPMRALADRAERLGAGESRIQPLHSGIAELDQVSEVLSRSAQRLTKSLASERDFAADASHQLRTPLTALLMRLEEISVTDDPEVVQEEANIAIAQVERLTRVVDDLMARTRRGGDEPKATVSLDSVIAALQREWQPAFEQARRSVHVHGERGLVVQAKPVNVCLTNLAPAWRDHWSTGALWVMPLNYHGKAQGLVISSAGVERTLTPDELNLVSALSQILACALHPPRWSDERLGKPVQVQRIVSAAEKAALEPEPEVVVEEPVVEMPQPERTDRRRRRRQKKGA